MTRTMIFAIALLAAACTLGPAVPPPAPIPAPIPEPGPVPAPAEDPADGVKAADYFHVAPHLDREYIAVEKDGDVKRKRILISGYEQDDTMRYSFIVPRDKGGYELVFGFEDEDLYLYAFKVKTKSVASDLIVLDQPALIGTGENELGGPAHSTPLSATTHMTATIAGLRKELDASLTGSVQAAWSNTAAVQVGDVLHDDVIRLKLKISLAIQTSLIGLDINKESKAVFDGTLARGFGYVEFDSGDDPYRLVPPLAAPNQRGASASSEGDQPSKP